MFLVKALSSLFRKAPPSNGGTESMVSPSENMLAPGLVRWKYNYYVDQTSGYDFLQRAFRCLEDMDSTSFIGIHLIKQLAEQSYPVVFFNQPGCTRAHFESLPDTTLKMRPIIAIRFDFKDFEKVEYSIYRRQLPVSTLLAQELTHAHQLVIGK